MTPAVPLTSTEATAHLKDALGANYGGPVDVPTLGRALKLDAVTDGAGALRYRPWATAARLIRFNTEYEVGGELDPRIDRKLAGLEAIQEAQDVAGGISGLVASLSGLAGGPVSGAVPIREVF